MIVSRLKRIAQDMLNEFSFYQIAELLSEAMSVSAERGNLSDRDYAIRISRIHQKCQTILSDSVIEKYPPHLKAVLQESKYKTITPASISSMLLNGMSGERTLTMSVHEIRPYLNEVNRAKSEFQGAASMVDNLGIVSIKIPEGSISLDLSLPQEIYFSDPERLLKTVQTFLNIGSYVNELLTGTKKAPVLIYSSTSDLILGLGFAISVAWEFLHLYDGFLDVALKHVKLVKSIRELRDHGAGDALSQTSEQMVRETIEKSVRESISKFVDSIKSEIPEERKNEIRIAISTIAPVAVDAIVSGVAISITIESLDHLKGHAGDMSELPIEKANEMVDSQRLLEKKAIEIRTSLGEAAPLLLSVGPK